MVALASLPSKRCRTGSAHDDSPEDRRGAALLGLHSESCSKGGRAVEYWNHPAVTLHLGEERREIAKKAAQARWAAGAGPEGTP